MANRCLYSASFEQFIQADPQRLIGDFHSNYHGNAGTSTNEAWDGEIYLMQEVLKPWINEKAKIVFEYDIPRLGKRVDVILLLKGIIFCLEFKVGKDVKAQADLDQVMDYALDLKNFHLFSHDRRIVPILVPTNYQSYGPEFVTTTYHQDVYYPLVAGENHLQDLILAALDSIDTQPDNDFADNWLESPYAPTPTIVEAARTLYENHTVEDIKKHDADTEYATRYILDVIEESKAQQKKSICIVTGVPGAGKTLVGLDVAIQQTYKNGEFNKENGAVYLSGNGPLVAVLIEALARDDQRRCLERGVSKKISDSRREVSEFIQIIHRYRDNMLHKIKNPVENGVLEIDPEKAIKQEGAGYGEIEHVAIFDEAQRSWTHKRIAEYLKKGGTYGNKLKVPNFPMSEAEFLIWSLDQREDWAVIICLVGGGQEINTGEAGIGEWIRALKNRFPHWHLYISDNLKDEEYENGKVNEILEDYPHLINSNLLHLSSSQRTFRANTVPAFIHGLLSFKPNASELYSGIKDYPLVMTRDIDKARNWLRAMSGGSQQIGILISKAAARYQPMAVSVLGRDDEDTVHWFLEDRMDIRSSNYLEEAATEIQVQGLELDFACVLWDADMRYNDGQWTFHKLRIKSSWSANPDWDPKTEWIPENNPDSQMYMLNAYRVLLTRARQGMVICVPNGNHRVSVQGLPEDQTRLPDYYDSTYEYLKSLGIKEI